MIRLLLDQGVPRSAVALLALQGWDVVHVQEIGLDRSRDEEIIEHARRDDRTICTLDADFHALLAVSGAERPSVIRIRRERLRGSDIAALLQYVWNEVGNAIEHGALVTVTEQAVRFRALPIARAP